MYSLGLDEAHREVHAHTHTDIKVVWSGWHHEWHCCMSAHVCPTECMDVMWSMWSLKATKPNTNTQRSYTRPALPKGKRTANPVSNQKK